MLFMRFRGGQEVKDMRKRTDAKTLSQLSLLHLSKAVGVLIPQIVPLLPRKRCFKDEKSHDSLLIFSRNIKPSPQFSLPKMLVSFRQNSFPSQLHPDLSPT